MSPTPPSPRALPRAIDCPICPRTSIQPQEKRCPGCGAELTPLWQLRELSAHYYNAGLEAARRGDHERAEGRLHCALELGADEACARIVLGKLFWNRGERTAALQQWRRAHELAPGHTEGSRLHRMALRRRAVRRLGAALLIAIAAAALFSPVPGDRSGAPPTAVAMAGPSASCAIVAPPLTPAAQPEP